MIQDQKIKNAAHWSARGSSEAEESAEKIPKDQKAYLMWSAKKNSDACRPKLFR